MKKSPCLDNSETPVKSHLALRVKKGERFIPKRTAMDEAFRKAFRDA